MNQAVANCRGYQMRLTPGPNPLPGLFHVLPDRCLRSATLFRNLFLGQTLAEKLRNPRLHTREFHNFS
jgi:hypothetical protein